MHENTDRLRRRTRDPLPIEADSGGREHKARKAIDDRCRAVRRWIDDDDEPACRGID